MGTFQALVLVLSVFTANSAVLKHEDASHARVARSPCDICDHKYGSPAAAAPGPVVGAPPPMPPFGPPPVFHTRNWSGYTRSKDGQQGVFSGAAAAASTGQQASNQAFSIAAADAENSASTNRGDSAQSAKFAHNFGEGKYEQNSYHNKVGFAQKTDDHQHPLAFNKGFEAETLHGSNAQSQQGQGYAGGYGSLQAPQYGNKYESSFGGQSNQHPIKLLGQEKTGTSAQSSASAQGGYGQLQDVGQQGNTGYRGDIGPQQPIQSGYGQGQEKVRTGGYGSGSSETAQYGASGLSTAQSTLNGALNLASQGVQSTEGAAGCSTCGKNSYAFSNAKSHSGSAVAVSVGG